MTDQSSPQDKQTRNPDEPVWTYRGYRLRTGEFVTAMVHFFRAEVQRANVWRQRLDTTTNWAVVATGAALSVSFSQPDVHHGVILLNILLVTLFLFIEARRYRYYELWSYRIRLMETDFYAAMLVPPFHPSPEWAESLAESLLLPRFPISILEAFGRRLRRNYLSITLILGISWLAKSYLFPTPVTTWPDFVTRCAVGSIRGDTILIALAVYYLVLILIAIGTVGMTNATGEILPRFGSHEDHDFPSTKGKSRNLRELLTPHRRRKQYLAFIITGQPEKISSQIMTNLKRGVTAMQGKGMFTGTDRSVLMCALTVTEIHSLKATVAKEDPQAFVIVSPAQEILGRGFNPLNED